MEKRMEKTDYKITEFHNSEFGSIRMIEDGGRLLFSGIDVAFALGYAKPRNEIVRGIKETGVKRIRIHDLRHSHASLLVELGFQPLAIAERLGHEKIETTLNTYSHLYPNKQAELADRLELENEEDNL